MTTAFAERAAFSDRLKKACEDAGMERVGPTELCRGYNVRSAEPITVHAVRKWLVGESIPAQEKLIVIANWLQVTPEWLRFGQTSRETAAHNAYREISARNIQLLRTFENLTDSNKKIVEGVLRVLLKSQNST